MGKDSQSSDRLPKPFSKSSRMNLIASKQEVKINKMIQSMNSTPIIINHTNNLPTINLNNRISKAHNLYQKNLKLFDAIQKTKPTIP